MSRRLFVFVLALFTIVSGVNLICQAQSQPAMTHHVREATRFGAAPALGRLPATEPILFDMVLALRHEPELDNFLQEIYDPASPSYRHFVTVQEFTERFGPSQEDYDEVIRFAKANGFTIIGGSRDAMDVQLRGSASAIERAFHVTMRLYQHPTENRQFFAPDREPTADLPFQLWHISGLDNYSIPHSALARRNVAVKSNVVKGSCPQNSYCGSDMRAAYYGGTALTGAGQTLGLLEFGGYDIADVNTYFKNAKQTLNVTINGISTDGSSLKCVASSGCDDTEQILDITQAVSMAPGLNALNFYVGNSDTALLSAMSTHSPLDAQLSSSWTWQPGDPSTDDPFFKKFAAQGQSYFQAAGDSGSYSSTSSYVFAADDDYVTSVGGTDLQVAGPGGAWATETAWHDGGGGYFTVDAIPIPSWQQTPGVITAANNGSTTLRNAPDVSAESNYDFYVCADQTTCSANNYGGTSFAAPMWAGYMALVNQQALANGNSTVGFINPTIYTLGLGSGYGAAFHDIVSGNNGGFTAIAGYDLATGWGSPNGTGLIDALAGSVTPNFNISASPNTITVVQGNKKTSTITINPENGFSGNITLSVSGLPSGVTAAFGTNPATSTSILTLTASATAATGTATVTVKGVSGGLNDTATISLTVNASTGSPAVTLKPTSLTWGAIKVGTTGPERTVNVTNSGKATLNISNITTSGDFSQQTVASSCGTTLAAGKTCHVEVLFKPTQKGTRTGTLTITDNAANSPQTVPLTGTGK